MHELIASPFLDEYLVLRPGHDTGVQIPHSRYVELSKAASTDEAAPQWNGSQLHKPKILEALTGRPPHHLSLSVYGATTDTYDGFTGNRGAFHRFVRGLDAAREARLRLQLNIVVTKDNADEFDAMERLAERYGQVFVFTNMSPTIQGSTAPIPEQAAKYLRKRQPFTGCNAGHTFFHADPFGHASICKIGREPHIPLTQEGIEGLKRLGGIADGLQLRTGGCSGCAFGRKDADGKPGGCTTCRPMAKLYQEAKAPRNMYCRHPDPAHHQ